MNAGAGLRQTTRARLLWPSSRTAYQIDRRFSTQPKVRGTLLTSAGSCHPMRRRPVCSSAAPPRVRERLQAAAAAGRCRAP
eukprot:699544-Prymnesium_polylepis.2